MNLRQLLIIIASSALISGCAAPDAPRLSDASEKKSETAEKESTREKDKEEETDTENKDPVMAVLNAANSWNEGSSKVTQYSLSLTSNIEEEITSWTVSLESKDTFTVKDSWNCKAETKDKELVLTPADYNAKIESGQTCGDIGMIIAGNQPMTIRDIQIQSSGQTIRQAKKPQTNTEVRPQKPAVSNPKGKLHVDGTHLVNADNEVVQLKGVSTHGLAWFPQFVNEDAVRTLHDDWGANVIRLAMYTAENGGYCTGGDQQQLKNLIDTGVQAATKEGMYVIIDWHILSDGNPTQHQDEAVSFFDEMSKKYSQYDNVLYEICNEPQNSPWASVIKPYAETIIPVIRKNDPDSVIIVGTNTWSQDVDEVVSSPLSFDNVLYTLHFYAGTHKDNIRNKLTTALNAGIPVFVSECSICDASGNGGIDYDSAQTWLDLLNQNQVSFIAWSLSNKNETSALIRPDCDKISGWSEDDLSDTGKWFYHAIKGK